jgi:hypothetical protein
MQSDEASIHHAILLPEQPVRAADDEGAPCLAWKKRKHYSNLLTTLETFPGFQLLFL